MGMVETANLKYYGISPFEIEIIYSVLSSLFFVSEDTIEGLEGSNVPRDTFSCCLWTKLLWDSW